MRTRRIISLSMAGMLALGCGRKPESPAASAAAGSPGAAAEQTAPPPPEAPPVAVLTAVQPQWIISDGRPKVEIALFGENLADAARVTSSSSQAVVEQVDPDPGRTLVVVAFDPGAPAGMYDFEYQAPGQNAIPFSIQYAGPK